MVPSSDVCATSTPLRLMKRTVTGVPRSRCIACAVARVAWPHRLVSTSGVNQRSAQSASALSVSGWANAVSERCISAATCCIQVSSGHVSGSSSRHTAAGFPAKGRSVNASMIRIRMGPL